MLVPRCVACVIDSTGTYIDGGKRNLLDDRFCGPAHQNGCDMTRNIPQPIWCIGPQKVCPRSRYSNGAPPTCRLSPLHIAFLTPHVSPRRFPSVLSFDFPHFFVAGLLITGERWKRTQFWSSKLAVIVELYDKPTLMVKVCPVFCQDAGICVFQECCTAPSASVFSLFCFFFVYGNLQATIAKYSLASLILLFKRVYGVNFSFSISPLILPIFLSL